MASAKPKPKKTYDDIEHGIEELWSAENPDVESVFLHDPSGNAHITESCHTTALWLFPDWEPIHASVGSQMPLRSTGSQMNMG